MEKCGVEGGVETSRSRRAAGTPVYPLYESLQCPDLIEVQFPVHSHPDRWGLVHPYCQATDPHWAKLACGPAYMFLGRDAHPNMREE